MPVFKSGDKVVVRSPTSNKTGETAVVQYRCNGPESSFIIYRVQFADGVCRNFRGDSLKPCVIINRVKKPKNKLFIKNQGVKYHDKCS